MKALFFRILPGMLINERIRKKESTEQQLSPVAQIVLLHDTETGLNMLHQKKHRG